MFGEFSKLMRPSNDDEAIRLAHDSRETPPPPSTIMREGKEALSGLIHAAHSALISELINRVAEQPSEFFERLIVDVLLSMGYGAERSATAQRLGRTGDGAVDGVIVLDELGLDVIGIRARRQKPGIPVPASEIRDFAAALEERHATKGVFVTTGHFALGAAEFCARLPRRVVLIDGHRLADIMMRYNIGVEVQQCFVLKGVDEGYFPVSQGHARQA